MLLFWVCSVNLIFFYSLLQIVFLVYFFFIVDIAALIRVIYLSFRVLIVELIIYTERIRVLWSRPIVKFFFSRFVDVILIPVVFVLSHRRSQAQKHIFNLGYFFLSGLSRQIPVQCLVGSFSGIEVIVCYFWSVPCLIIGWQYFVYKSNYSLFLFSAELCQYILNRSLGRNPQSLDVNQSYSKSLILFSNYFL